MSTLPAIESASAIPSQRPRNALRVAFVTNFCPHYRVRTFESLARHHPTDFLFFSAADEWYWEKRNGARAGAFPHEYLRGFRLFGMRVTPALAARLWRERYDVIVKCINGRFALPLTYAIARLRRRPFILWTGVWMSLRTPFHRLLFPITRHIYRHADAIVVYGEHVKRYLESLGVPSRNIFVARHAIDNASYAQPVSNEDKTRLRRHLRISENDRVILYVGRLETIKGLPFLLDAMRRLGRLDVVLVLAGDGSGRDELEKEARKLQIVDRVRFEGYVPPESCSSYYAIADVFVLPSIETARGKETWGLAVNEAMNQGLPVIATDAVGAAAGGLVRHGVNGFVVPQRDSPALASALEALLSDEALRREMGAQARATIAAWDNEQMVAGFLEAVDFATREKQPGSTR